MAFPEPRIFKNGSQLLGYLEGRPGVTRILKVEPWKSSEWRPGQGPKSVPGDVKERIAALPQVVAKTAEARDIEAAWLECEDDGAWVESEIDYEEVKS